MRRFRAFLDRRVYGLGAFALLLSGLALANEPGDGAAQAPSRPNVVVVTTDDQTAESMRFMDRTTERLGGKGATFETLILNRPLCCPSRATLLTGQYAHNHGVLSNHPPAGGFPALDSSNTLATWLEEADYVTGHVGKYLNGYGDDDPTLVPPGWTEWFTSAEAVQKPYDYLVNENGSLVQYGNLRREFKGDVFTQEAVDFISRRAPATQPFYLQVDYNAPHVVGGGPHPQPPESECAKASQPAPRHATAFQGEPLPKPPSFNEEVVRDKPERIRKTPPLTDAMVAGIRKRYRCAAASILHVDEGVDAMLSELRRANELDQTLILFTSDNGVMNGEHRLARGKGLIYEESTRVPLLIRGPGFPAGAKIRQPVSNADIAPTILDATGVAPERVLDGQSLQPVAGEPSLGRGRAILTAKAGYAGVRTRRYVYAMQDTGEEELYDLREDPFQLRSRHRSTRYLDVRARLAQRLDDLRDCIGAECRE